jgi:hypothetical protein
MTRMPPKSSTMAKAVRKTTTARGAFGAAKARMPKEKAISVAIGTPQPLMDGRPILKAAKKRAGTAIPPAAAAMGRIVADGDFSSPKRNSRLISRPMTKKKIAMRPSLIQCSNDIDKGPKASSVCNKRS